MTASGTPPRLRYIAGTSQFRATYGRSESSCAFGWSRIPETGAIGGRGRREMPRFGAHMSVAGGLPRAVERAVLHRCEAMQIFAKNASQWRGRVLPVEEVREFRSRVTAVGITPVVSHASYLINLASGTSTLRNQSI